MTLCNERLQVMTHGLKGLLYDLLCHAATSTKRVFFSFTFYFVNYILFWGWGLQGQRMMGRDKEKSGIKMPGVKSTKNQQKSKIRR